MTEHATLAGGCFWCIDAAMKQLEGVSDTIAGYAGGSVADPTYEAVCRGDTGHAEAVQLAYDPAVVGYADLLEVFFSVHDPTTRDREGPDVGSQYRSAIFVHDDDQRATAEAFVAELGEDFDDPIVTEIEPLETFYPAAERHQDYFAKHPDQPYCSAHVRPKVRAVRDRFADRVTE